MKLQEEKLITDEIYGWEELENSNITISPELVVSINDGFGITDIEQYQLFGDLIWDEECKCYRTNNNSKIYKASKFNILKDKSLGLYKIITPLNDETCKETKFFVKGDINDLLSVPVEIDGTNSPIYSIVEEKGLALNFFNDKDDNLKVVYNYIKFFFHNVTGRHGKFYIIEDHKEIDHILKYSHRIDKDSSIKYKCELADDIEEFPKNIEMRLLDSDEKKVVVSAYIIFKDSLFSANVNLDYRSGQLELSDEKLVSDLEIEEDGNN